MAHLGHPLVGDATYGKRSASVWQSVGVSRQLLHAYRLSFQHPTTGRPITVWAPVPPDLMAWLGPWQVTSEQGLIAAHVKS